MAGSTDARGRGVAAGSDRTPSAGLAHATAQCADFLVRINWHSVPLHNRDHARFDIIAALRSLPEAEPQEFAVATAPDRVGGIAPVACRLVAIRKSEVCAELARSQVLYRGKRKGRAAIDIRTVEAAGYTFVLTSLPLQITAGQVLELYRFRWQIELAFKRLKTILHLINCRPRIPT